MATRTPVLHGLPDEALESIERTAYRLLAEVGIALNHAEAEEMLHGLGCRIADGRTTVPAEVVDWALENVAPHREVFKLQGDPAFTFGDGAIRFIADRVAVMYLGKVVELAETEILFTRPKHPYTEALMSAISIPDPRLRDKRKHIVLAGEIPSPRNPPPGCHFHPRCRYAKARCSQEPPGLITFGDTDRLTACYFPERVSGGVPIAAVDE